MLKKFAVVVLAVAMLMSYMGLASAAVFTDTAGHKQEAAIDRLTALELLKGYPDGTFKPEAPITRAEFATVIVRALGLEAAAQMMAGTPTVFSDVYAGHWATGYINVAASQGIVNGYPDGTFKPEANVTYAEALKMILCALGYTPETFRNIVWPTTWIAKAIELGLTDGVTLAGSAAGLPANRADVARMVDNALDVPKLVQVGYGDQTQYVVSGTVENVPEQTLLQNNLNMTKVVGVVEDAGVLLDSDLDLDVIEVKEGDKTNKYTVTDRTADIRAMVGLEITAWANSDGEIFLVTDVDDVQSAYVPAVVYDNGTYKVRFGSASDYKTYTINKDVARVYYNHTKVSLDQLDQLADDLVNPTDDQKKLNDDYVKANYIVEDGKVVYLDIVGYDQLGIVEEVNTKYGKVLLDSGSIPYKDKVAFVTRDGKRAAITDLQAGDVVYWWEAEDQDKVIVVAFSEKVSGELESRTASYSKVTLGGKSYSVIPHVLVSADEGDTFEPDADTIDDLLGTDVTLYLGIDGKVVAIAGTPEVAVTANYGLVTDAAYDVDAFGKTTVYVRLYNTEGKQADYAVTKNTKFNGTVIGSVYCGDLGAVLARMCNPEPPIVTEAVYNEVQWAAGAGTFGGTQYADKAYLVKYTLTSDGKLATVDALDLGAAVASGVNLYPDDVNDRIREGDDGVRSVVRPSTKIFHLTTEGDLAMLKWETIEKAESLRGAVYESDGEAKVILVTAGEWVTALDLAVVTGNVKVAGGYWKITLDVGGESKSFTVKPEEVDGVVYSGSNSGDPSDTVTKWVYLGAGDLVRFDVDAAGDLVEISELPAEHDADADVTVQSVSAADKKLVVTVNNVTEGTFWGDANTVVYDCTGDAPEYVDFSAIRRGDKVQVFEEGGTLIAVKIVE